MVRDTRGEAVARVEDWFERQRPRHSTDGHALSEEELFAAYSVGVRHDVPAPAEICKCGAEPVSAWLDPTSGRP